MYSDSVRFFESGYPMTTAESIKTRMGLCEEFSNIVTDFCKILKIPNLRIEGYVKYLNFKPGDKFTESNHVWNAVYVDSTWRLFDLFWATNLLEATGASSGRFVRRLDLKYFLGAPATFMLDHLPADPVFQFENRPLKIEAFTASADRIDLDMERLPYLNHSDSLAVLLQLSDNDRALRIAQHAYQYNRDNPNALITEYYNYGVSMANNRAATKPQLMRARQFFMSAIALTDKSTSHEIKTALKDQCRQGVDFVNRRLNTAK